MISARAHEAVLSALRSHPQDTILLREVEAVIEPIEAELQFQTNRAENFRATCEQMREQLLHPDPTKRDEMDKHAWSLRRRWEAKLKKP